MKKLFSPNCVPPNLQRLRVGGCKQLEEIITSEVEPEERGMVITEFHLPQLRQLLLNGLPELKSICSAGGVLVCDSLVVFQIVYCPKLKRMGLNLPKLDNVPPSASANLSLSVQEYCNVNCSEEYPLFSRFILFSLSSFSSLKSLYINDCGNMKKLFSPNCVPPNLQMLSVRSCKQLEEIITSEVETEERGMVITEFHLPQLGLLSLGDLPELKNICSAGGVLVCDSLGIIGIVDCPKLKRMGLNLPKLDNVPPSASANLSLSVRIRPKKWWESVEWDGPQPKSLFDPFVSFR
ncbi:uncharacterized protein LOC120169129 [Hibiscus syriacus]|nr:uncharacterized protein LOC120169129 [Hibiscus syriacus]